MKENHDHAPGASHFFSDLLGDDIDVVVELGEAEVGAVVAHGIAERRGLQRVAVGGVSGDPEAASIAATRKVLEVRLIGSAPLLA